MPFNAPWIRMPVGYGLRREVLWARGPVVLVPAGHPGPPAPEPGGHGAFRRCPRVACEGPRGYPPPPHPPPLGHAGPRWARVAVACRVPLSVDGSNGPHRARPIRPAPHPFSPPLFYSRHRRTTSRTAPRMPWLDSHERTLPTLPLSFPNQRQVTPTLQIHSGSNTCPS